MLFEGSGGFDELYMKMLASGIPTAVHLMWIPFSELDFGQQFRLMARLAHQCLNGLLKMKIVSNGIDWVFENVRDINDDIVMMTLFPLVELVIPYPVLLWLRASYSLLGLLF